MKCVKAETPVVAGLASFSISIFNIGNDVGNNVVSGNAVVSGAETTCVRHHPGQDTLPGHGMPIWDANLVSTYSLRRVRVPPPGDQHFISRNASIAGPDRAACFNFVSAAFSQQPG